MADRQTEDREVICMCQSTYAGDGYVVESNFVAGLQHLNLYYFCLADIRIS